LKCHLEKHVDILIHVVETDEAKTSQKTASNAVCEKEMLSKIFHSKKVTISMTKQKFLQHLVQLVMDNGVALAVHLNQHVHSCLEKWLTNWMCR